MKSVTWSGTQCMRLAQWEYLLFPVPTCHGAGEVERARVIRKKKGRDRSFSVLTMKGGADSGVRPSLF